MKKNISLIKATMSEGMNVFRINTKKQNKFTKILLPIFLALTIMWLMYSYSELLMQELSPIHMEFVLLTLFVVLTSIMTLIEGIYKSGNLLFNCKDDNLLLSLPIKKSTVLFIRVFKFYVFELIYNSLFLLPAIILYAKYMNPNITYYVVSFIGLLLFPIVPILLSTIIGTIITFLSSRFKGKNYVQTIITTIFLIGIMYFSYNSDNLVANIASNASSINDFLTKIYYPVGIYIELITNFQILTLIQFILVHVLLFVIIIVLLGKIYFDINSSTKTVKANRINSKYKIKASSPIKSLIKKEFNRFINSTVFIVNAGFGLVLFVLGCILFVIKYNNVNDMFIQMDSSLNLESYMPVLLFGFVIAASFMTSITSSMISLEGKSFNILKSLPVKPYTIVMAKVLAAIMVMIPCFLVGDIIIFVNFHFDFLSIILILIASVLFPLVSETIGIIVNLKYPKMDAQNDTEVVKQSMSSMISVFIGMALFGITIFFLFKVWSTNISNYIIILIFISIYLLIYIGLLWLLRRTCDKNFNNISV